MAKAFLNVDLNVLFSHFSTVHLIILYRRRFSSSSPHTFVWTFTIVSLSTKRQKTVVSSSLLSSRADVQLMLQGEGPIWTVMPANYWTQLFYFSICTAFEWERGRKSITMHSEKKCNLKHCNRHATNHRGHERRFNLLQCAKSFLSHTDRPDTVNLDAKLVFSFF